MAASFVQQLKAFWETQSWEDGETFVETQLKPRGITNLGILLALSRSELEEKFPIFHEQLFLFIKRLSVNEQLLKEIGMDMAILLSLSREKIVKRFPVFHEQLQHYIQKLPIGEMFFNALNIHSRDFDTIKDNLAKENRDHVEDIILGFDNMQQIIDRVIWTSKCGETLVIRRVAQSNSDTSTK